MPQPLSRLWGVAALLQAVGDTLHARYGQVLVRGEVASFTSAASGHVYFTLKDEQGRVSLRCVMFRRQVASLTAWPADGQLVDALGQLSVYDARGELQLVVDGLRQAGAGALYEQFLRLKDRMQTQGWFDSSRKRLITPFPRRIAVVTSANGAALQDVITTLQRRSPYVEIWVLPCLVQGHEAPAQIVAALQSPCLGQNVDALILCRGGGSLEDLWAFNDERVVQAVLECAVPVVCGVGHETDITLADLAADLRAPTPTAAAELVARSSTEALDTLSQLAKQMQQGVQRQLDQNAERLDQCAWRIKGVTRWVPWQQQNLMQWQQRLVHAVHQQTAQHASLHKHWACRLEAINPQKVLTRGYAWVTDTKGRPLLSSNTAQVHQKLRVQLADGQLAVQVEKIMPTDST